MDEGLTEVKRCHGSKKRKEMTNQRTYVERSETIRVKKSLFLNRSLAEKPLSAVSI